ncbi:rna-directed dna polymerase from mobile element jockey-like [Pitangus sulphuratus]|nr:rna-directed dna polymerase from mobile element jockey-like [Pitangus sulphuratus]
MGPLLKGTGTLATKVAKKTKILNTFFASDFTIKTDLRVTQEMREKDWGKEYFPLVEEDWVRNHLVKLNILKSMGPDGMHTQVLRELVDIIAIPLLIIFERSWKSEEVPEDWKKANVTPVLKKGVECLLSKFTPKAGRSGQYPRELCSPSERSQQAERFAGQNFQKFSKGKCRVLHMRKNNPRHQDRLGTDLLGSSSVQKDLRVLVDNRLS